MKNTITVIACLLLLLGCGKPANQQPTSVGFKMDADRAAIVKQLEQMKAKVVEDTPELLQATFTVEDRPMQVRLGFAEGKLKTVNYIQ
jgi:hypothetical protein